MEARKISSSLRDEWSQELSALGDDVRAIESSLGDIQEVFRLHAAKLNSLNIVVTLPADVLEVIFLDTQHLYTMPLSGCIIQHWLYITFVCRRWRQIALNFAPLWTDIDVGLYGVPLCKAFLLRVGLREFALNAIPVIHHEILSSCDLRDRAWHQLSELILSVNGPASLVGPTLDLIFSHEQPGTEAILRQLKLKSDTSKTLPWASMRPIVSNLEALYLKQVYPIGVGPSILPQLTTITLDCVLVTSTRNAPGILGLLRVMPAIESVTLIDCTFSPLQGEAAITLPPTFKSLKFRAQDLWHAQQVRALSPFLLQSSGDRTFSSEASAMHEYFMEVRETFDREFIVREISLDFGRHWEGLDVCIELSTTANSQSPSLRIHFNSVTRMCWSAFCSSLNGIDMRDATMRIICERSTPFMYSPTFNPLAEIQQITVSTIHISGAFLYSAVTSLFLAMRQDSISQSRSDSIPLAFVALRDIAIGKPPTALRRAVPLQEEEPVAQLSQLDDSASHLLWYARARRNRAMKPLRTVASPDELLNRPWINELKELIDDKVVSYNAYMNPQDEAETMSCRAVVLYRPLLRVMTAWDTRFLAITPVFAMLGLLWSTPRRK